MAGIYYYIIVSLVYIIYNFITQRLNFTRILLRITTA